MKAKMRLFLNADQSALVAEDSSDAASLYAGIGDEIPTSAAEKFGLVDGLLPDHGTAAPDANEGKVETTVAPPAIPAAADGAKETQAADDKEQAAVADKEAKAGGKKSAAGVKA